MENKLYIAMYHYIRDLQHSRYPKIKGLDVCLFKNQLDYYQNYFNVVSMEQVIETIENCTSLPQNALLLTFDEGYIDNFIFDMPLL